MRFRKRGEAASAGPASEHALPAFRYHPDPRRTGFVVESATACRSCGNARGFVYTGPVYASEELEEEVCPWCIADGTASERFGAEFTDVGVGVPADVPSAVLDELRLRTPGYSGWQQERWLYHCGDAAAFLGLAGITELESHPGAVDSLRRELADALPPEELDSFVAALDADNGAAAYLFRCLHCGGYLAYADFA